MTYELDEVIIHDVSIDWGIHHSDAVAAGVVPGDSIGFVTMSIRHIDLVWETGINCKRMIVVQQIILWIQ